MKKKLTSLFSIVFFTFFITNAQNITVKGNVKDAQGVVMPGVNILVKGTNKGTSTDFSGNFDINARQGDALVFSYLGYKSTEHIVTGSILNVILEEDASKLDEVVVTAFGIEKKEKSLGYSVQKIEAEDVNTIGQINPFEALQGKVAGVQINKSSGTAGGGVDILIRGFSSVNPKRSNQPLIIVDGIALNNDTFAGNVLPSAGSNATGSNEQFSFSNRAGDLNPEDIETFNILKGAAATALYGIRASNGAIVITTKKGKQGKTQIELSASTSFRRVVKTPTLQKTYREGHRTSKIPAIEDPSEPNGYNYYAGFSFYSWGVPYSDDSFTLGDGTVIDLSNDRFYNPYDLFRTGVNSQVNLNISGATEKLDYYLSVGTSNDEGVLPNTDYKKNNFRFKGGYQVSDNFKINSSITYTKSGGSRGVGGDKSVYSSLSYWSATFDVNDYLWPDGSEKNYSDGFIDNPRYLAEKSNLKDDVNRWIGNVTFNWVPLEWLNINYSAQVDNYSDIRNRFVPPDVDAGSQVKGFVIEENINFTGLESNFLVTLSHNFSEDFSSSLLLGHQLSDRKTNYSYIRGEGLNISGINEISNTLNLFGDKTVSQHRNVGVFADLRLEYKDKLFLSITGRNDWLSEMPPKNRSFFYPSVSASYLFNEVIDPERDIFSFGKLRVSWAQVGKGPDFGQVGRYFKRDPNFPFSGAGGYRISTELGDVNLVPERSNSFEIGTDLRFLKNRIRLDYSFYKSKVNDQIFPVATGYSSGLSSYITNAGDYETWGHEILLSADIIKNKNLIWKAIINWSTNNSEITSISTELDEIVFFDDWITNKAKVGDKLGTLYGWVFQTAPNGQRYVNSDGKWVVTGSENAGYYDENNNKKVAVGNAFPDYILSLNNTIKWKDFTLDFLIEYKSGGDLYDRGLRNGIRNGNLAITEFRDMPRVLEGVMDDGSGGYTTNTQELIITANDFYRDANNYNAASEILLQDGSWLKLRNIGLTYTVPNRFVNKIGLSGASLNVSASNIILWTPFDGFDPESNQFSAGSNIYGFTGLTTPQSQSYSMGVSLEF